VLDDNTLKVLVEYYSNVEPKFDDVLIFPRDAEASFEQAARIASYNIDDLNAEHELINASTTAGENVFSQIIDADYKFKLKDYLLNKNSDVNSTTNGEALLYYLGSNDK